MKSLQCFFFSSNAHSVSLPNLAIFPFFICILCLFFSFSLNKVKNGKIKTRSRFSFLSWAVTNTSSSLSALFFFIVSVFPRKNVCFFGRGNPFPRALSYEKWLFIYSGKRCSTISFPGILPCSMGKWNVLLDVEVVSTSTFYIFPSTIKNKPFVVWKPLFTGGIFESFSMNI